MKIHPIKPFAALVTVLLLISALFGQGTVTTLNSTTGKLNYPVARKSDQVDDYNGTKVADPYRWLEDLDSPETKAWVEAENKLTFSYLNQIPERAWIKSRLTELWNYERFGTPFKEGGRYFYTKNSGLQNQSVLYTVDSLDAQPRLLLDPNTLSTDGTVALSGLRISHNGKLMAYGLAASGSDWTEWHVRDVDTGKDMPDTIKWVKFSNAAWTFDDKGFFYSRYDEPVSGNKLAAVNEYQKLYYHRLGTQQSDDMLVYSSNDEKQKRWTYRAFVTDDGRYMILNLSPGASSENRVYYKDLQAKDAPLVKLLDEPGIAYRFIDNDGPVLWFSTDKDAPHKKVIAIDTRAPEQKNWKTVIPEAKETLNGVNVVGQKFVASYLKDAHALVKVYDLQGRFVREVELPGIGNASGFDGKRGHNETFYSFTSYTTPTTIYHYDVATGKSTIFRQPKVAFNPNDYEVEQVFYTSKDGTRVPMFLTHKKGLKLDGNNPTLLYAYRGFDISELPGFSVANLIWLEMGGVYAVANLRGGGEYGKEWHEAGMKAKKQNVFDDFIAAAEWLIKNKYTSTPRLAINGGSNGGLLVGAVLTQRPELFGAALPAVGVMDMLRFPKFTIGAAWMTEYGSPDNTEDFKAIYAYSPLHNIKPGTNYPPTLITTADHDDRVWPGHSFKFTATLQAAQAGPAPILIRIETKAGHGAGRPISKTIEEVTDRYGFLVRALNMKVEKK
ncbi:MAG TPA: prolyl oligopeptidase family serine peptidase [Pyrinomonadaceae bacterium]|nr:prolyl oligopeptidase family serine peptidase [Pyrinomonadaceae bacterium]